MKRNYNNSIGTLVKEHEFAELNCNCKPLHRKNDEGAESWREYDDNNNQIHVKNCITSYEYWLEYDNKNRLICIKDSDGNIKQWDYNPLSTHYKDNSGYESWIIYDKNGKPIRFERNSDRKQYHDVCNMSICDMYPDLLVKTTID